MNIETRQRFEEEMDRFIRMTVLICRDMEVNEKLIVDTCVIQSNVEDLLEDDDLSDAVRDAIIQVCNRLDDLVDLFSDEASFNFRTAMDISDDVEALFKAVPLS